ncbi:hypothetical protein ACE1CB_22470 [Aerosakkonema sp. BLCC-F2]
MVYRLGLAGGFLGYSLLQAIIRNIESFLLRLMIAQGKSSSASLRRELGAIGSMEGKNLPPSEVVKPKSFLALAKVKLLYNIFYRNPFSRKSSSTQILSSKHFRVGITHPKV